MDTSEIYIKMASKSTEIQRHKTEFMDWYVCRTHHRVLEPDGMYYSEYGCPDSSLVPKSLIWLPTQGQLQEMVPKQYAEISAMVGHLCQWIRENDDYLEDVFWGNESMEQLWLAFVMKEKYGKTWNGEEWVNVG